MFASKYYFAVLYNSAIFLPWLPSPGGRLSSSGSVQSVEVRRECGCIRLVVVLANGGLLLSCGMHECLFRASISKMAVF